MKDKKKNLLLFTGISLLCLAFVLGVSYAIGTFLVSSTTINSISTPTLKVALIEEYTKPDHSIFPTESVDKVVNAKNTGNIDSLVRIKVEKLWGTFDENGILVVDDTLSGDNILIEYDTTMWVNGNDGYFYYKGVLKPGETTTTPLFTEFSIDANTSNAYQGKDADVKVTVESIQYEANAVNALWNKTYEFLSVDQPSSAEDLGPTIVTLISPSDKFNIEVNKIDLFTNFKDLTPGTGRTQEIQVTNNYIKEQPIYLRAELAEQAESYTDEQLALVDKLLKEYVTITVKNDGNTIYTGPVWGNLDVDSTGTCSVSGIDNERECNGASGTWTSNRDSMLTDIYLGKYQPEETKNIVVTLNISSDVSNEYQNLIGNINWTFTTEFKESALIVHHYRIGTTERVPSDTIGNYVKDEYYLGNYGAKYTTKPSKKVSPRYTLVVAETVGCDGEYDLETGYCKGTFVEGEHEIDYFYRLTTPGYEDPVISKDGDAEVTDEEQLVHYDVDYSVKVTEYKGQFVLTVTDQLPSEIDVDLSDIDGGTYNAENKTITWVVFTTLDTYENGPADILFSRSIDLKYLTYDYDRGSVYNVVSGKMDFIEIPYSVPPITDDHDIPIKINGTLTVEHYIDGTDVLIKKDGPTEERVSTSFTTNPETFDPDDLEVILDKTEGCPINGYNSETGECNGKYIKGDIVIKYYYKLKHASYDDPEINKDGDSEIVEASDLVDYSLSYNLNVTRYLGDAVLTITDQLPKSIDPDQSVLEDGVYDAEALTITWTISYNDINTFNDGDFDISFEKNISVLYTDYDYEKGTIDNELSGSVEFVDIPETIPPITDTHEVPIEIKSNLTVEHYIDGTDILLKSDGPTEEKVSTSYTTNPEVFDPDDFEVILDKTDGCPTEGYDSETGECNGKYTPEDTVIKYFYKLKHATYEEPEISKDGDSEILKKTDLVNYSLNYSVKITKYLGAAILTITDQLPKPIDSDNSILDGGVYDAEALTITWTITYDDINTFSDGDMDLVFARNISVLYTDYDYEKGTIDNELSGTLEFVDIPETIPPITDTHIVPIKIKTDLKVEHYIDGTDTLLDVDGPTSEIVGTDYTTTPNEYEYYYVLLEKTEGCPEGGYDSSTGTCNGKYSSDSTVIKYYYKLKDPVPDNKILKDGIPTISSKETVFDYTITYNAHLKNYNGEATVSIVDTLPYKIDTSFEDQDLDGGVYDEKSNTITWTVDVTGIELEYKETFIYNIKIKYNDIDYTKVIENKVVGTLKYGDTEIPTDGGHTTTTKIPARVIVNHYYEGTTTKVADSVEYDTIYGAPYATEVSKDASNKGYIYVSVVGNVSGIVDSDTIIVNYYYARNDNPYTGDNIINYLITLTASISVLGCSLFFIVKENKKKYSDFY